MMTEPERFDELHQAWREQGENALLEALASQLRAAGRPRELFEVLKMQARLAAGQSPLHWQGDAAMAPAARDVLEQGMFAACREVGMMLLDQGRIREGWLYLQPVGDTPAAARRLAGIEATSENIEELIEVSLYEGVDTRRGYQLLLEHYGVCNSITAFESALGPRPRGEQQAAAELLVRRLHADLLGNVRADLQRREGQPADGDCLRELLESRPSLLAGEGYHIDTTHLASTVRYARVLQDEPPLRLALDLTEYGRRLSPTYRYPGEEPFADQYASHAHYFRALLGENLDESLAYFAERARGLRPQEHGRFPLEVYAELLARVGRPGQAIQALDELSPPDSPSMGIAPSMLDLHLRAGMIEPWLDRCRQNGDALGYVSGLVAQSETRPLAALDPTSRK